MKPSFALVLTQDTIGLLHRTSQGWHTVGEAAVSDPDLTEALSFLRKSALGLDPGGLATKLVIPNSEILYTTVHAPGPSAAARRSQIKAALEGRTPYAVGELVFDWRGGGPDVQVAVVARETLQEAEAFAVEHRLGPLSFVGSPEAGTFDGEPWFGPSAFSASLLTPGEKVERDQAPVPRPASAGAAVAVEPAPDPVIASAVPETVPGTSARSLADAAPPEAGETAVVPERDTQPAIPEPVMGEAAAGETAPLPPEPQIVEPVIGHLRDDPASEGHPAETRMIVAAAPIAPDGARDAGDAPLSQTAHAPAVPAPDPDPAQTPVRAAAPAPVRADEAPPAQARPVRADVIAQSLEVPPDDLPPKSGTAGSAPAVERLKARLAEQPVDSRRFDARPSGLGAAPPPLGSAPAGGMAGGAAQPAARPPQPIPGASRPGAAGVRPAAARAAGKSVARGSASMVTSPSIPMPRDRRVNIPVPDATAEARARTGAENRKATQSDGDGLTAFGGKQARRGKPRYLGLILTGLLLILLAAVAAWSSYFLASDGAADAVPVAAAPAATGPAPTAETTVEATATAAAESDAAPQAVSSITAIADADPTTATAPPAESAPAMAAQPAAAEPDDVAAGVQDVAGTTTVATSGSAAGTDQAGVETATIPQPDVTAQAGRNPPVDPQDEIFLAMTDPAIPIADLIALAPPVASADPMPRQQSLPPPFGTVYQFDANGMIVPTEDGIVTPEGVLLVMGKPSRVPPERPAALAVLATTATTTTGSEPAAAPPAGEIAAEASVAGVVAPLADPTAQEPAPAADPALAGARPRSRPADLVPASGDDAALPPDAGTQVTSLRPRERPAALLAAEDAAKAVDDPAAIQSAAASLAVAAEDGSPVSPLAIAVSRKPAPRPGDFSKAVEAAVASIAAAPPPVEPVAEEPVVAAAAPEPRPKAAAVAPPQEEPAPAAKAKDPPATEEIDEPEVASAAPDLPTRANVAKQATFRNAINLSKVNLIGVYGSASNRYALVRQPNGRYVKVSVGDRVDGGKVAAISDRELRYVKNGRTVTLALPKS